MKALQLLKELINIILCQIEFDRYTLKLGYSYYFKNSSLYNSTENACKIIEVMDENNKLEVSRMIHDIMRNGVTTICKSATIIINYGIIARGELSQIKPGFDENDVVRKMGEYVRSLYILQSW